MPFYWKWLYWMSPFQWYVRAMLSVILHDQPIHCAPSELVTFNPPPGLTYVLPLPPYSLLTSADVEHT